MAGRKPGGLLSGFALPADAHPIVAAAHAYWLAARPDGCLLPGRQHIDALTMSREMLPHVWLVDVRHSNGRDALPQFRYRLIGSAVTRGNEKAMRLGRWIHEVTPDFTPDHPSAQRFFAVVRDRRPDYRRGAPNFLQGPDVAGLERITMPLASDGAFVDMLFCVTLLYDADGRVLGPRS